MSEYSKQRIAAARCKLTKTGLLVIYLQATAYGLAMTWEKPPGFTNYFEVRKEGVSQHTGE